MAVTITRTPWIDDDGSGTTGTVLNNAVKTYLYTQIDAALAKVAQLVGGNTFTGNQAVVGNLSVTGYGQFVQSVTGAQLVTIQNQAIGASNYTALNLGNDTGSGVLGIYVMSSNSSAGADTLAGGTTIRTSGAGGLILNSTLNALRLMTANTDRLRILASGEVCINCAAPITAISQCSVAVDNTTHFVSYAAQNLSTIQNTYFFVAYNNAAAIVGSIQQTGATTLVYNTSSDQRLKDDAGRATDLSALRAVVIHDFTWKADGIRDRGVFAQEAHAHFPRAVSKGTDDLTDSGDLKHPWQTDYSKFVADLIVGWQQHDGDVSGLWQAVHDLRADLATLKGLN